MKKKAAKPLRENLKPQHSGLCAEEILESTSDAFYAVDADWRLTYINHRSEKLWHRHREELLGTVLWDVFPEPEKTVDLQMHHKVATERVPIHWETFSPNLRIWVDANAYPASDGGITVYFRDITDRKRAEEALRESEEKALALVEELKVVKDNLSNQVKALNRLQEISSHFIRQGDMQSIYNEILDAAIEFTNADCGDIQIARDGGRLEIVAV